DHRRGPPEGRRGGRPATRPGLTTASAYPAVVTAAEEFAEYVRSMGLPTDPGLDESALDEFEADLGIALPDSVRALYRACGGHPDETFGSDPRRWHLLSMRLLPPAEVLYSVEILRELEAACL